MYELVDIDGNPVGKTLTEWEAHNLNNIPEGYYMPVVGVVIINNNNEILLQKRSKLKKVNPNKWGICGGKIEFGETAIEAGIRETIEEIGVELNKNKLKLLSKKVNEKTHFTVYYINENVDINKCILQKKEVEE